MTEFYKQIITLFAIPIYAVLIPVEILLSNFHGWKFYSLKETMTNVYLNLLNAGLDILLRGGALFILVYFFQSGFDLYPHLHPVAYWALLFFGEDLLFWLEHYVDHHVRLFWAVHVTHHSSGEYNLTTGFRSSVLMPFYRFMYFIPLALLGFRPMDIIFMYAITQIYGILVHTQAIGKLPGIVEYIFVTPSHHRVHHASNVPYLDRNMGMVLIIWDRLFGTFTAEIPGEVPRYGLTKPLEKPNHPVHIVVHEWQSIGQDFKKHKGVKTRLKYLLKAPGWSPDGSSLTSKQLQEQYYSEKATIVEKEQPEDWNEVAYR